MLEFEKDVNEIAYRGTCCMCCGIPQVSHQYFIKADKTLVQATVDHVLLKSLGGSSNQQNLVLMCYDCNQLRANHFAELDEFIDWYWSGEEKIPERNFSYLNKNPKRKSKKRYRFTFGQEPVQETKRTVTVEPVNAPVLEKKHESIPLDIVEMNGVKYRHYKHPLFGNSLIKIEE